MKVENKYLLAICIPTLNRSNYLRGLLENISLEINNHNLSEDIQVVIVDGKSNDDTESMVKSFNIKCDLKYFRREERKGIDKDIIKSVELSNSKYCWLFSDDDRFTNGALSHLLTLLRENIDLSGCFSNRLSFNFQLTNRVVEINEWPGKIYKKNHLFTKKGECIKALGMDFGFISSQIINRHLWLKALGTEDYGKMYKSYYLMVHIFFKMMDENFKWLFIQRPLLKQRTGNDTLLNNEGVMKRQRIEHESFEKILALHYSQKSDVKYVFFKKMVNRLPRAIANLKAQNVSFLNQLQLINLLFKKYKRYSRFWITVVPIFFIPNILFYYLKKFYLKIN